jgi:hypothetical protein
MACAVHLASSVFATASAQSVLADREWTHPVTPWGEPDLRGRWPIAHMISTPLERPVEYGTRRFLNDEELAKVEASVDERNTRYEEETGNNKMGGGHWAEPTAVVGLTSMIVDPPNGRLPEMTAKGKAMAAAMGSGWVNTVFESIDDFDSWDRCITRGLPVSMLPRNYNNGIAIIQSPGWVAITLEMAHETRLIPTDGRPPLDPAIEQWLGESRGHWEGNTLVVETRNFNGGASTTNPGVPGSPRGPTPASTNMRLTERFTRLNDDTIDYQFTVTDPEVLTQPWTVNYPMRRDEGYVAYEYACHEGNTAVRNYIETSRAERARQ